MNILQRNMADRAPLAPGEYAITVLPGTARVVENNGLKKLEFAVETTTGKRQTVSFVFAGDNDGLILSDMRRLDGWVRAVDADISDGRIGNDYRRIPFALAAAQVGKTIFATFAHKTGRDGNVYANLVSIRVDDTAPESEPDFEYDEAGDE